MLRTQILVAFLALVAIAGSIFLYHLRVLEFPLSPDARQSEYYVEGRISFTGGSGPVSVRAAVPQSASRFVVLESDALATGFGVLEQSDDDGDYMLFEQRSAEGEQNVFYRVRGFRIDSSDVPRSRANRPAVVSPYSRELRQRALRQQPTPFLAALDEVIATAEARSADEVNFVRNLALILGDIRDQRVEVIIEDAEPDLREPELRFVTVLQAANIPARRVVGLPVTGESRNVVPVQAVEVYLGGQWQRVSPRDGLPVEEEVFIPLTYSGNPVVTGTGTRGVPEISFSVRGVVNNQLERALWTSRNDAPFISWTSLFALPSHSQLVFRAIFLVPLGALVIAFLRQIIGISTFGTFMPVLIALSFREIGLLNGLGLFIGLVGAGLLLRAYFSRLHLLLVPRLTAVLAIVTLLMALIALVGNAADFPIGLSIALFPLVILTMTIERMSIMWEEVGPRKALIRGGGSIICAVLAWILISNKQIEHLLFVFPELLLVVVAFAILLGSYNGYKLSEYLRFSMFRKVDADTGSPAT